MWPENILRKHSCFFFTLEKIKYKSTGNQTFPIVIMSIFRTKLYMQHLRSLVWFLLTMLSILSLTTFPLISVGYQVSAAPSSSKSSFFRNLVHYLTVTKTKCIWSKYTYIEAIQITSSSGIYRTNIYHNDCQLRLYIFKFNMNNSSFFRISASLF